ncbi:MAG TPA: diaminopimelate epimerase [Opitutales bacterium]|nr:diaminopimelate epimerase [Opitutales bacterium]
MEIPFHKYHALGNDYLVLDPADLEGAPSTIPFTPAQIERICHRNFGLGSDGILWGPFPALGAEFGLAIFNPDGGEAEKSGNGLRIFTQYLHDIGCVENEPFAIWTKGGIVRSQVREDGLIVVDMGSVSFKSDVIPVLPKTPSREVIGETITVNGRDYTFCAATIGNPHCVLPMGDISEALAREIGPVIENDPRFPNRTNVQLLKVLDRANIAIEIWERGAGYTLASGSSSSAAASVARRLGLVDADVSVHMPGGVLNISIGDDFSIRMTGPATRVGDMQLDPGALI